MTEQLLLKALVFAAERHKDQTRKGKSNIPYINHPIEVAHVLSSFGETEYDLLIAAFLHDVIEDTVKNDIEKENLKNDIRKQFGSNVLEIVLEVSDNKSLSYKERKKLQVINTPNLSDSAKKIKIADKICNILDIKNRPPEKWSNQRKLEYLKWAKSVVNGAVGLNKKLDQYFFDTYNKVHTYLKNNKP
ncbi:MAG: HD domain-containing protein [Bacteroidales bacterium]|nr:HD domain-containing protein [Bacteroidales bacterium]